MESIVNKAIDDIVEEIISSSSYKMCIKLKEQMATNQEIVDLVNDIKNLQKKYVNSLDEDIKDQLTKKEKRLNEIPIYVVYMENLERVNEMIIYVKDELNQYFYDVLNSDFSFFS